MLGSPQNSLQINLTNFDPSHPFVVLENQGPNSSKKSVQLFFDSVAEIKVFRLEEVLDSLNQIEALALQSNHLLGYIAYEAFHGDYGLNLESQSIMILQNQNALVYFHAFKTRVDLNLDEFNQLILPLLIQKGLASKMSDQKKSGNTQGDCFNNLIIYDFACNEHFESYQRKIQKIKEHQRDGETYQVNFTFKNTFQYQGKPFDIFSELRKYQKVKTTGFYHFDFDICSYSPELFISKRGNQITAKPMKGTAARGTDAEQDQRIIAEMLTDEKTLSENLMIVDLIRNDLGRIAEPCSVQVPRLFEIETFETLFQMTSTVEAEIKKNLSLSQLIKAVFPCGSITGAPKKSTMQIIDQLESDRRGVYTGALGYIEPSGDFQLNVAIRTLLLSSNQAGARTGEMGLGSGIVYESDAKKEWEECLLKSQFVKRINSQFQLIETFGWDFCTQVFVRLDLHLKRLSQSAFELGFSCDLQKIKFELEVLSDRLKRVPLIDFENNICRIRLVLFQNGAVQITNSQLESQVSVYRVILCAEPIQSDSAFQRYKTTHRTHYEYFFDRAKKLSYDEILFFNENSFLVEASRHNLFIKRANQIFTPPISDGALPGVLRQTLIQDRSHPVIEKSLNLADLKNTEEIYLGNSLRGLVRAEVFLKYLNEEELSSSGDSIFTDEKEIS
jgi:para-aminobenzoate synthetase/4-amino-4-deoxychorismate lyase